MGEDEFLDTKIKTVKGFGMSHKSLKELLYDAESLDDYIEIYEHKYDDGIDMSPYQIQSTTENRMIKELKKLNLIIKSG